LLRWSHGSPICITFLLTKWLAPLNIVGYYELKNRNISIVGFDFSGYNRFPKSVRSDKVQDPAIGMPIADSGNVLGYALEATAKPDSRVRMETSL
jgi:hypothetical protein